MILIVIGLLFASAIPIVYQKIMVDMEFSKHGLLGAGVLSGVSSEVTLRKFTPHVIKTVENLFDSEGNFLFEEK